MASDTRADPVAGPSRLPELARVLKLALLGVPATSASGPLSNRGTASAFLPGSGVRAVDLGPGLWALVRTSANGERRVLCAHNVSDQPVTFDPSQCLSAGDSDQGGLLFLSGAASTHGALAAPTVRVAAHSFVWLGRFNAGARPPNSTGRTS